MSSDSKLSLARLFLLNICELSTVPKRCEAHEEEKLTLIILQMHGTAGSLRIRGTPQALDARTFFNGELQPLLCAETHGNSISARKELFRKPVRQAVRLRHTKEKTSQWQSTNALELLVRWDYLFFSDACAKRGASQEKKQQAKTAKGRKHTKVKEN